MWNSKTNFLVVITDHVKDSSEGIAKNILEELWLMPRVSNTLFVIPVLDTSLSLEDTDYVPVIDIHGNHSSHEKMCKELAEVVHVDGWYWDLVIIYTFTVTCKQINCPQIPLDAH
jgi:hypothetical protein